MSDDVLDPETLARFKDALLISAVRHCGGTLVLPVQMVDDAGLFGMVVTPDPATRNFTLTVSRKQ